MNTGDLINHTYRILQPIGSGGLGVIYLGYHENLQKYVVIIMQYAAVPGSMTVK